MSTEPITKTIVCDDPDQIIEPVDFEFDLSPTRRSFVAALGAGLIIATVAPAFGQEQTSQPAGRQRGRGGGGFGGRPVPVEARVHLGKDGSITVLTGKVEGGQGARTEISQAAAEELRVPLDRVQLIMADTALCPDDGGTYGSQTTPRTLPSVRSGCAAARQALIAYTAERLKLSPDAITVTDGAASAKEANRNQRITYADFASSDPQTLKQVAPPGVELTPVKDWSTLGKPTNRTNGRDIVTGKHQYPSDMRLDGMLYGKILRPPAYGAKLTDIDLAPAKAMEGVIVVRDNSFVGVAAPNTSLAKKAVAALEESAKWELPKDQPASKELSKYLRDHANVPASPYADQIKNDAKTLRATYTIPYVQHAPMEPRAAAAQWKDGSLTVWTGSQNPTSVRNELVRAFRLSEDKVRVIIPDFGGGFGGKHTGECAVEAARLAQAAQKPVALRWTRPEEFTWAYFRPAAVIDVEASLAADGTISTWHFVNINAGRPGVEFPYRGKANVQAVDSTPPLRHGSYRALAATGNNFARECFMNELAMLAGKDPLDFRLANLDNDRIRAVLEAATKSFGWTSRKKDNPNIGHGLACATEKGSFVATCAEVEIDKAKNTVRLRRITQAFECGKITNPKNLYNQVMGAIVQGVGPALREAMEFEDGKIKNASFYQYEVPRQKDVPLLDIQLIDRPDVLSAGAGETPLICLAPAIGNAIFDAIGVRLRDLPLTLKAGNVAQAARA